MGVRPSRGTKAIIQTQTAGVRKQVGRVQPQKQRVAQSQRIRPTNRANVQKHNELQPNSHWRIQNYCNSRQ